MLLLSHYLTIKILFLSQKPCCTGAFCIVLYRFCLKFEQKSKKICQFFVIFSLCVSTS